MFRWLTQWLGLDKRSGKRPPSAVSSKPRLEPLENREVMAAATAGVLNVTFDRYLAGDFTGDGKDDVAVYSDNGAWNVLRSEEEAFRVGSRWARWSRRASIGNFYSGDFNGDAKADVAGIFKNGVWRVGLSSEAGFTSTNWADWEPTRTLASCFVGDFNGDGKTDVAGLTRQGTLQVGISTGASFTTTEWATGLTGIWTRMMVGDFDGDGRDDLVGFREGEWHVARSTGTAFEMAVWGNLAEPLRTSTFQVGDFNGDGRDDVGVIDQQGNWQIGLSNGTSFTTSPWSPGWDRQNWKRFALGDFNGDGKADIAGLNLGGAWRIALSDGSAFSQLIWPKWARGSKSWVIRAADLDGDGRTDLTGREGSGIWWVTRHLGSAQVELGRWFVPYRGEFPAYNSTAPWLPSFPREYVIGLPSAYQRKMFFNSKSTFEDYALNYQGLLRRWLTEAQGLGQTSLSSFRLFLRDKLDSLFVRVLPDLQARYSGLTSSQYRLLMSMNLVHGHYLFGTTWTKNWNVLQLIRLGTGDCSEHADLIWELAELQGIPAITLSLGVNYRTNYGQFVSGHMVAYAEGLWLDPEINMAIQLNFPQLLRWSPSSRLSNLLNSGQTYGFYNWYLAPHVRAEQLSRGQDGGVIAFYYHYYFEGMGQGGSTLGRMRS